MPAHSTARGGGQRPERPMPHAPRAPAPEAATLAQCTGERGKPPTRKARKLTSPLRRAWRSRMPRSTPGPVLTTGSSPASNKRPRRLVLSARQQASRRWGDGGGPSGGRPSPTPPGARDLVGYEKIVQHRKPSSLVPASTQTATSTPPLAPVCAIPQPYQFFDDSSLHKIDLIKLMRISPCRLSFYGDVTLLYAHILALPITVKNGPHKCASCNQFPPLPLSRARICSRCRKSIKQWKWN